MNRSLANRSMSQAQQVKAITLQGSAQMVMEFFKYAVNSILYQRGVYAPETFERTQQYGITLFVTKDKDILQYFDNILPHLEGWLSRGELRGVSLLILSAITGENLEKWDFDIQTVNPADGDTTITGRQKEYGKKELAEIQKGIRNVMRQVTATVTFLPLLDARCAFDLQISLAKKAEVADGWLDQQSLAMIDNPEQVQLRSFSTSIHRVNASVTYKADA
ncbi:Mitotic spindle assembly checkpoint protein MAD2A [Orchesella cincta]|uniref:Mitotic spindle assembly checkpoint protein MAD2A n=1 Tax=Orchesella cincta TaxID=48709 RepID=A0A1D2MBY4_ORCCI|nr:Mitotic spindle assembly checkpoint protein MAD2A [Orchesella cincta]